MGPNFHVIFISSCPACPDHHPSQMVHPLQKRPNCGALLNAIFDSLDGCNKDENGICQRRVKQRKRSLASKFMKELQQALDKKR